jgi:hypothetical protein
MEAAEFTGNPARGDCHVYHAINVVGGIDDMAPLQQHFVTRLG